MLVNEVCKKIKKITNSKTIAIYFLIVLFTFSILKINNYFI
jgi:hypothetical protein